MSEIISHSVTYKDNSPILVTSATRVTPLH